MKIKVLFALVMAAMLSVLLSRGAEYWTNYPVATYPDLVTSDWTFLVGSKLHRTNDQVTIPMMLQITKTNAQAGMQPLSANLTSWAGIAPGAKEDQSANLDSWSAIAPSAKQNASGNLDLWSAVVPSSYQPILGYTPATTNFATLLLPGLILPDGTTLIIDPTTHKLSAVSGGSGTLTGPGSITAGHIATWSTLTGLADGGHALSEYTLLSQVASGSQAGVLSASDWTTFNGKQAGSANLTSWASFTPTGYTNGLYSVFQPLNSNLSLWSSFTPVNYTNNLYSLFQPALGFTPLTFQQTSNLILTLTIPLDALSTNGQVTLFGIDSNTNAVPVHARNNLTMTANGLGGYDLDASGSGGSATPITFTNLYGRDTNALIIDPAKAQTFSLGMLTNNILVISNTVKMTNLFTHDLEINLHQWTNGGAKLLALRNLTGLITTNGTWTQTTNANATDKLILRFADGTYTNIVLTAVTNCSTYTDTNSLLAGGGGGGSWPSDSILGHYLFNGNLNDSSGNSHTLTAEGSPTYVADESGTASHAVALDGSTMSLNTGDTTSYNFTLGAFSVVMYWTNTMNSSGQSPILFGNGQFGDKGYWFQAHEAQGGASTAFYFTFAWNGVGGFKHIDSIDRAMGYTTNACVVFTSGGNGGAGHIYLNGAEVTATSQPAIDTIIADTGDNWTIGKYLGPIGEPKNRLGGNIQEMIIYSRALTSGEVTTGSAGASQ